MTTLDTLVINLVAETAQLHTGMQRAQREVASSMKGIEDAVTLAKNAFLLLGGAMGVQQLGTYLKGIIDATERMHDLSIQTGVSVESLSALVEVGKYTDTGAQDIANAMAKLAKNTSEMGGESKRAADALKAIGIDMKDFQKLKPEDQFLLLAKTLDQYADGSEKAAFMQTVFGREGAKLLPFFRDLAPQQKLNATLTKEQAETADKFNDAITAQRSALDNWVRGLVLDALPTLTKLISGLDEAAKIAAAYAVTFVGLPALVTGATTALAMYRAHLAAASAAAEMGIVANTGYVASLKLVGSQLLTLKGAGSVLFAAFAGWQIGKYLRENFLVAQLAGIEFVGVMLKGWEYLKFGSRIAWEYIKSSALVALDAITLGFAGMLNKVGQGLAKLGADDTARALTGLADRLKAGATASADLERSVGALRAEMDRNLATINAHIDDMANYAIANFGAAEATEEHKRQLKALTETELEDIIVTAKRIELANSMAGAAALQSKELKSIAEVTRELTDAGLADIDAMYQRTAVTRQQTEALPEQVGLTQEAGEYASAWQRQTDSVLSGLTDALYRAFEAGKGFLQAFVETLKNTFNTLVLRPQIEGIMRPVAGAVGGMLGGAKSAFASGGGLGSMGSTTGLLSGIGGLGGLGTWGGALATTFGAGLGFGASWLGAGATLGGTLSGAGAMLAGGSLASVTAGIGALVGALGPIALGIGLLVQGFSRGPKQVTERGIDATISGGDMSAQLYEKWKQSGGWFVGSRRGTRFKDLPDDIGLALEQSITSVYGQVAQWAEALALPADKLADVTHQFRVQLGKDDAETQKNIEAALAGYRDALAARFADVLAPFQYAGETLTDTLQRLVGIQAMSEQLNAFGGVFSRIAQLSVDAREELIGFAGGIEALIQKAQSFVGSYYSEGEKAAISAKAITEQLAALGIDPATLKTKADFRGLVEGTDISTTEGRRTLDSLLTIAQAFAPVADYLATAGGSLADLAGSAPQSAVLESMFKATEAGTEYQAQTVAGVLSVENAVTASGDNIVAAVNAVAERVAALEGSIAENLSRLGRDVTGAIEALPA